MGLPSDLTDRNFLYLQHLLKLNPREVWGILDYSWILLNINRDPTFASSDHLEALLHWQGKRGALTAALLKSGYIQRNGKTGYIITDWPDRLFGWVRQAMLKPDSGTPTKLKHALENSRRKVATDPDPGSSPKRENIHTLDLDRGRQKDRDRPKKAVPAPPESLKNPRGAVQDAVSAVLGGLQGVGVRQTRQSAPPPTQPIGSYTAKECALAAASLDRNNDHDTAVAMWTARAAEISQYSGGLDYFRDLLCQVHNAANPQLRKGVGPIHNPAAFLNTRTADWLAHRRPACNA